MTTRRKETTMQRHSYANPEAVGYAAWYTRDGVTVAFETLGGQLIYEW